MEIPEVNTKKRVVKLDSVYEAKVIVNDEKGKAEEERIKVLGFKKPPPPSVAKPTQPPVELKVSPDNAYNSYNSYGNYKKATPNSETTNQSNSDEKTPKEEASKENTEQSQTSKESSGKNSSKETNDKPPSNEKSLKKRKEFKEKKAKPKKEKEKSLTLKMRLKRSKFIERLLKTDHKKNQNLLKIILLGTGESGKSTIIKQMKLIHQGGFSTEERNSHSQVILDTLFGTINLLIQEAKQNGIEIEAQAEISIVQEKPISTSNSGLSKEVANALKILWSDPGIQETLKQRNKLQIVDNIEYLFSRLDSIAAPDYIPSNEDILRTRIMSTGIVETDLEIGNGFTFKFIDVGGQRSERKKWIHCFDDVAAILFCVALNEYDLTLREDDTVNRLEESLKVFDDVVNNKSFSNTSIIVFLNKVDLFSAKIKHTNLTVATCCKDYTGGNDEEKAKIYLKEKFERVNRNPSKSIYFHYTTALDTDLVKKVFEDIKESILRKIVDETF